MPRRRTNDATRRPPPEGGSPRAGAEDRVLHVGAGETGQTLAAVIRRALGGPAWSQVERLIRGRHVLVQGNLCLDGARRVKAGEVVKLLAHPTAPLPTDDDVKLCYVDSQVVVVEKPAGITSVRHAEERDFRPSRKQLQPTLEDLIPRVLAKRAAAAHRRPPGTTRRRANRQRDREGRSRRMPPVRPVHRLDRDTSGLMVFARTVPAERHLGQQFRRHDTHRRYLAVVHGHVAAQTIESRLVRDRGDGRRGSTEHPGLGKRAVTHVRPLERLGEYTLIECRLETGRTHQIRIHLAELGHPLCGEKVYIKPLGGPPQVDRSGAPRIALHAAELAFEHPVTGERMEFSMPLPADLEAFVARLRAGGPPPRASRAPQADRPSKTRPPRRPPKS